MFSNAQIVALVALFAATAVRRTERGLIDALEASGAVTPEQAIALPLTNWLKKMLFRRLLNGGAVGETMEMKQYLNVVGYAAYRRRRMLRGLVAALIAILIGGYLYLRSRHQ